MPTPDSPATARRSYVRLEVLLLVLVVLGVAMWIGRHTLIPAAGDALNVDRAAGAPQIADATALTGRVTAIKSDGMCLVGETPPDMFDDASPGEGNVPQSNGLCARLLAPVTGVEVGARVTAYAVSLPRDEGTTAPSSTFWVWVETE